MGGGVLCCGDQRREEEYRMHGVCERRWDGRNQGRERGTRGRQTAEYGAEVAGGVGGACLGMEMASGSEWVVIEVSRRRDMGSLWALSCDASVIGTPSGRTSARGSGLAGGDQLVMGRGEADSLGPPFPAADEWGPADFGQTASSRPATCQSVGRIRGRGRDLSGGEWRLGA
jgi:hypothetical protein